MTVFLMEIVPKPAVRICSHALAASIVAAATAAAATPAVAQHVSVGYQLQDWSSARLHPLHGARFTLGIESGPEIAMEFGTARWSSTGTACSGGILTVGGGGACLDGPLRAEGSAMGFSFNGTLFRWRLLGGDLSAVPSVGLAVAHLEMTGTETGDSVSDSSVLLEVGVGARYRTPPVWRALRLYVELRQDTGLEISGNCEDCSNLDDPDNRRVLLVGVTVGLR